jgi:hypothetical protein
MTIPGYQKRHFHPRMKMKLLIFRKAFLLTQPVRAEVGSIKDVVGN